MDAREQNHQWYARFDRKAMQLVVEIDEQEERSFPAKFEVCDTCDGKGTHVNPSIDSHGLSAEDFAEDPDFAEDYMSGAYDVTCAECHGERVVPVVDWDRVSQADRELIERTITEHYNSQREQAHERRMGY